MCAHVFDPPCSSPLPPHPRQYCDYQLELRDAGPNKGEGQSWDVFANISSLVMASLSEGTAGTDTQD